MRTAATLLITIMIALLSACETENDWAPGQNRSLEELRADWDYNRRLSAREHADFRLYLENYAERLGKTTLELNASDRAKARRTFRRDYGWKYPYRRLPYRPYDDRGVRYDPGAIPPPAYRPYHYSDDSWW